MFSLFKTRQVCALDMGGHSLKLAQVFFKKNGPVLQNFARLPVPEDCVEEQLFKVPRLASRVRRFVESHTEGHVYRVRICISGKMVIVKKIEIPQVEKKLMDELVYMEARETLPFDLDEVNYSYRVIECLKPLNKGHVNALLVAARKSIIFNCEELLKRAGLKCDSIDVGGFALAGCLRFLGFEKGKKASETENVLVLDVGRSGTEFSVLNGEELVFSRILAVGGEFFNQALMKDMDIEDQEAEALKVSHFCDEEGTPEEVHRTLMESTRYFCDELQVGFEYFHNQFPGQKIHRCYVSGGGCQVKNLREEIEKSLQIPTEILNPFQKLSLSEKLDPSMDSLKYFSPLVVGLCLGGHK